jgi:hypothetical protein
MTDFRRTTAVFATIVLILAACGGAGDGGGGTTTAAPTDAAATTGPTQATVSETPAEPPTGGGGTASDVCGLVTADELAQILNVPSVTTTVFPGPPDTCSVDGEDGTALAAWVLTRVESASAPIYESMMSDPSAIEVSGIGDKAAHVQNTGFLVLKGDVLFSVGVMTGVGDISEEERRELAEQIGAIAAGRM